MPRQKCITCGKDVQGRADKKYCSIPCKNQYHYQRKNDIPEVVKTIDRILHTNRSILSQLFEGEKRKHFKFPKVALSKMGFDFSYYTGTYLNKQGKRYHYIYDYAWMEFSLQEVLLVRKR